MTVAQDKFDVDERILRQEELILEVTELLATVMQDNDISKADLARRMGRSKAFVTQCLSGGQNLTMRTLADLFHTLGYRLQVGAVPGSKELGKQIVRLYPVGGWAFERADCKSVPKGVDRKEPMEALQAAPFCEAA